MSLSKDTKIRISEGIKNLYLENKKHTDCDWIFDDCKEDIIKAVKDGIALSRIVEVIKKASNYTTTIDETTKEKKTLKVTTAKLAKWLRENGVVRKAHRKKKTSK